MTEKKSFLIAIILSFFGGVLGLDRFYLGCTWTGVLKLITFGGIGIWALIDTIRLAVGSKLCGGFTWDTEKNIKNHSMKGGVIDDTLCIILSTIVGLTLFYYYIVPRIQKKYISDKEKTDNL